jgi:hypothetical protein
MASAIAGLILTGSVYKLAKEKVQQSAACQPSRDTPTRPRPLVGLVKCRGHYGYDLTSPLVHYNDRYALPTAGRGVWLVEEQMPTYLVGDLICVAVGVAAESTEHGFRRIVAKFVHEADSAREIELSDDPASLSECQVQKPGKLELAGRIVHGIHPPGVYRCRSMTIRYPGGRNVPFSDVPNVRFRVVARTPEVVEWQWLQQT